MKHKVTPLCWSALCTLLALATVHAQDSFNPNPDGFIQNWLILAPIPLETENSGAEGIDKKQVSNEAALKPKEGDKEKVGDKQLTWKKVKAADYFFDLNEILGQPTENSVAYAVCYVVSDSAAKDLKIAMGSNDQGKVYVNGKEILKFSETGVLEKDKETADVILNKGVNTVVFKTINENNNWQGCLRFTDKEGHPAKNLKVQLTP